jgi:hypothetical protein
MLRPLKESSVPEAGAELLRRLEQEPVFVLTADQDWAPSWTSKALLDITRAFQVPLHVFRTNACPVLDASRDAGTSTNGWHPNFGSGSSHGATPREVVQHMQTVFPSCRTSRSHRFIESTEAWKELRQAGIVADSQFATLMASAIRPLRHWTGIVRIPVFLEDDIFFEYWPEELPLAAISDSLFSPGLKVLNFHPAFVGCNTPSRDFYESTRDELFDSRGRVDTLVWHKRGTRDVLLELLELIRNRGSAFEKFEDIAMLADHELKNPLSTLRGLQ